MNDLLELSGSARERGRAHGEALREEIRDRIAKTLNGVAENDVAPWWRATEAAAPAIAEELIGVAEGAGSRLADVVQINAFEALDVAQQADLGAGGCTVIGVSRAGSGPLLAQNWDSSPSSTSALGTEPDHALRPHLHCGPDTLTTLVLASPGGIGWVGMNEAGVALVNADLFTHRLRLGVPSKVMRRVILAERSRSEGLRKLHEWGGVGGRSYLVGDLTGADLVEVSAEEPTPIHLPQVGRGWVHTNHAVSTRIAPHEDTAKVPASSPARYARAGALMQQFEWNSFDEVAALLADHRGDPYSVCCHVNDQQPLVTAASVIFDCELRQALVAIGNPCTAEFRTYQL